MSIKTTRWLKKKWDERKLREKAKEMGIPLIVVLEVGREIHQDVEEQRGETFAVISAVRDIKPVEFPIFPRQAYEKITEARRFANKTLNQNVPITLILSGPVSMNFQLGQLIGFHEKIVLYQWDRGKYVKIPNIQRKKVKQ